jgi:hypothetical protein
MLSGTTHCRPLIEEHARENLFHAASLATRQGGLLWKCCTHVAAVCYRALAQMRQRSGRAKHMQMKTRVLRLRTPVAGPVQRRPATGEPACRELTKSASLAGALTVATWALTKVAALPWEGEKVAPKLLARRSRHMRRKCARLERGAFPKYWPFRAGGAVPPSTERARELIAKKFGSALALGWTRESGSRCQP